MLVIGMSPSCHLLLVESKSMQPVRHKQSHMLEQTALERQDLSCMYLAEPLSIYTITIAVTVVIIMLKRAYHRLSILSLLLLLLLSVTGAERRAHAQESFMPHHWATPTSAA